MDKAQALHNFWSSFNLTAYDESTVPTGADAPDFPYITYNVVSDSFGTEVAAYASLWYKSSSWAAITAKADEISAAIGMGGKLVHFDGGALWIKRGTPFAQRMADGNDDTIRRIYINITLEYISAN